MSCTAQRHPPTAYSGPARPHPYSRPSHRRSPTRDPRDTRDLPPSPPRSQRAADSPPMHKVSVDQNDNYWDDVPPAPASLKSILDSFRRSGEGDRDLLMAILQAKKSEEERLTAIIQTRLTILQARLNMAAVQAQMPPAESFPSYPPPGRAERQERHASTSSSVSSPANPPYYYSQGPERIHLPPPMGYAERERLPPMRQRDSDSDMRQRPVSPRESTGGLEMLLEGVREAEREDRTA
ncbi:hypothetical protein CspeluHIS016_0505470 [Cutaneotrichosporon spelunceum]|uniref:Uncharacterized protein n=1 Tax=Cutaneotrichosporon spelunceum TaxID=1672016 RepID=A0AAD3TX42_9TREE|nr:hypothetical protein CspeluHIS016_0505470 [Cutaneotrichosporon spelunceum]